LARAGCEEGIPLVTVASMAMRRSLDTTAIYTKPPEGEMANAVEKLSMG